MKNFIMNFGEVRIRPMELRHADRYAALCPKQERDALTKRLKAKIIADAKNDVIKNFIIINNDFIVGIVSLEYLKDIHNGYEVYSDANMEIHIPQERHKHLTNQVAMAMIKLCKATWIVDNLGLPAGKNSWTQIPINPNSELVCKTA